MPIADDERGRPPVIVASTITKLPDTRGAILVTGSHGGTYCGYLAVKAGLRAAIFHDAGIGLDEAGIASLAMLEGFGIAAASVSHLSARVGDTDDMMRRGRLSRLNGPASALGIHVGMECAAAADLLRGASHRTAKLPPAHEARTVEMMGGQARPLTLIDSAALVDPEADLGAVVVTGSHGGLVGGKPAMALQADAFAAAFNDAGIGIDEAGLGRLGPLDARGIAAITVSAASACIGNANSTLNGIVSATNATARQRGARLGVRARDLLLAWTRAER
jgi:uncharacterized protein YunC (DUF1805 family)